MYDLVIIGSGPAGLAAAIYAKRACLNLLLLEKEPMGGGQIIYTEQVDNYPGLPGINGFELAQKLEQHARELSVPSQSAEVVRVEKEGDNWKIILDSGAEILTQTVLLATGASHRKLGVPGEAELTGAGVSYCATCDGAFFRDKTAAVVGGGDVALEDALYLAKGCKQVYLIHRRQELRAAKVLQEQVMAEGKITFIPDTVITEIKGNGKVEKAVLLNKKDGTASELPLDAVFIAVGMNPETDAVASVLTLDNGYVRAGEDGVTEQPGLFVAGDVRTKRLRQIVTAVSDGANAVTSITDYLAQR
ncbi:MAG: FAD-dependent oxidoreductase [Agathobacter sp.]|nr:FAD-dependent oxidoreductase [Agathobacter sp.]MDY4893747.1 FAD-dependent oxidoreductase [Agathobacter sp.]